MMALVVSTNAATASITNTDISKPVAVIDRRRRLPIGKVVRNTPEARMLDPIRRTSYSPTAAKVKTCTIVGTRKNMQI